MNKPRICEVLGVEVGERFNVYGNCLDWHVDEKGHVVSDDDKRCVDDVIYLAINHPDRIIRKPRWTEQEVEIAELILRLYERKDIVVGRYENGQLWWKVGDREKNNFPNKFFPSIRPSNEFNLIEIIGGAE